MKVEHDLRIPVRSFLLAQWVKNMTLSLLWFWSLLWLCVQALVQELPHAVSLAKRKKKHDVFKDIKI